MSEQDNHPMLHNRFQAHFVPEPTIQRFQHSDTLPACPTCGDNFRHIAVIDLAIYRDVLQTPDHRCILDICAHHELDIRSLVKQARNIPAFIEVPNDICLTRIIKNRITAMRFVGPHACFHQGRLRANSSIIGSVQNGETNIDTITIDGKPLTPDRANGLHTNLTRFPVWGRSPDTLIDVASALLLEAGASDREAQSQWPHRFRQKHLPNLPVEFRMNGATVIEFLREQRHRHSIVA